MDLIKKLRVSCKPFVVVALMLLFGLVCLVYAVYGTSSQVSTQQMADVIWQAGHGKVDLVQDRRVDGIPAAQVRYPNHSLHTVFFLVHAGKIRGIVVGGHIYDNHGTPWVVAWTDPAHLARIPNPVVDAQARKATGINPADGRTAAGIPIGRSPLQGSSPAGRSPLAGGSPVQAQTVLRYVAFAHGFVWGHDKHTPIDVLVDPNCVYCHQWFLAEKNAVNAGKISFQIVPVAALKPSSIPRAIEILSAKNPLSLWLKNETAFRVKTESGGIPTTLPQHKAIGKIVAVNTAILYAVDHHHPFTPTFVDHRTGQVWIGTNHNQELNHAFVSS